MQGIFGEVPWELCVHVLSFLDASSLMNACLVAKGWLRLVDEGKLLDKFKPAAFLFMGVKADSEAKDGTIYHLIPHIEKNEDSMKITLDLKTYEGFPLCHMTSISAIYYHGKVYYMGGFDDNSDANDRLFAITSLNDHSFVELATAPQKREGAAMAAVGDHIYLFGGTAVGQFLASVDKYHIPSNTWTPLPHAEMDAKVAYGCALAVKDNLIYLIGGRAPHPPRKEVLCFDTTTERWISPSPITSMINGREGFGVATVKNSIYVFGATVDNDKYKRYERYVSEENKWEMLPSGPEVGETVCGRYGEDIYIWSEDVFNPGVRELNIFHTKENDWYPQNTFSTTTKVLPFPCVMVSIPQSFTTGN